MLMPVLRELPKTVEANLMIGIGSSSTTGGGGTTTISSGLPSCSGVGMM